MHWGTPFSLMVPPMLRPAPRAKERYLRPPWPCVPYGKKSSHHAQRLRKISLGDAVVANGIGISHAARFPLGKPGWRRRLYITAVSSLRFQSKEADQAAADGWRISVRGRPARTHVRDGIIGELSSIQGGILAIASPGRHPTAAPGAGLGLVSVGEPEHLQAPLGSWARIPASRA